MTGGLLRGWRIVTTRDTRGRVDSMLAAQGADVVHVPLIEIVDPPDGGVAVRAALANLEQFDWLAVTSHHGARRVGAAARSRPELRLAAVGAATADVLGALAGRSVDVVPVRQTAAGLAEAMPAEGGRVLVAQADRADATLAAGLRTRGYDVETVVLYSTRSRRPSHAERQAALGADAVAFASGSAVQAWVDAFGCVAPPVVAAIGPTTAAVGERLGLKATHVAADHDVEGLTAVVIAALAD